MKTLKILFVMIFALTLILTSANISMAQNNLSKKQGSNSPTKVDSTAAVKSSTQTEKGKSTPSTGSTCSKECKVIVVRGSDKCCPQSSSGAKSCEQVDPNKSGDSKTTPSPDKKDKN
jgi:hypothetical protein